MLLGVDGFCPGLIIHLKKKILTVLPEGEVHQSLASSKNGDGRFHRDPRFEWPFKRAPAIGPMHAICR